MTKLSPVDLARITHDVVTVFQNATLNTNYVLWAELEDRLKEVKIDEVELHLNLGKLDRPKAYKESVKLFLDLGIITDDHGFDDLTREHQMVAELYYFILDQNRDEVVLAV